MFEAYKVGITIALTNHVSSALALIGRDLVATDIKAARLNATLKEIKTLGIAGGILGGAGLIGLRALDKSYDVAKKYEQSLNQFKAINLGDAVDKDADRFARGANVIGASAIDLIDTVRDLHMAFNDYGVAKALAPHVAQMRYANQAVYGDHGGMDMSSSQLQAMEKIVDMKGGWKDTASFLTQMNMMQKVISGTGGMVKPSDFLHFIKTAGVSGRLLSNESFYYTMEPLIQEMTGGRVGTGTMSAYNNLAQGRATVRAAKEMMKFNLLDPNMVEYDKIGQVKQIRPGALKGMDEFTSNPYQWMKDVLIPAMTAKGITSEKDVLNEMGVIFGNRTGSNLFSLMFLQDEKIAKNMAISKKAMDVDALLKLAKTSPQGADIALDKAWENLHIAVGESIIPIVIPALLKLAEAFRLLGGWIDRHPIRFDYLIKGFAGLSAAMAIGGVVLVLTAGFKGLALVLRMSMIAPMLKQLGAGFTMFGRIFLGTGPIGLTIAAIGLVVLASYEIYTHWKDIKPKLMAVWDGIKNWISNLLDWIVQKAKGIGGAALAPLDWIQKEGTAIGTSIRSAWQGPPPAKNAQTPGNVYLDGHPVGKIVAGHMANAMDGPATSGGGFDGRQSFVPVGATGSW